MTNMTTLLLRRRRSSVPLPRSRCLATLNSSGNLANSTSSMNLSFINASRQYGFFFFFFKLCLIILSSNSGVLICKINHKIDPLHITWQFYLVSLRSEASGKEEESPAQGYGGGSGMPLSDNENSGAETRPWESKGDSFHKLQLFGEAVYRLKV